MQQLPSSLPKTPFAAAAHKRICLGRTRIGKDTGSETNRYLDMVMLAHWIILHVRICLCMTRKKCNKQYWSHRQLYVFFGACKPIEFSTSCRSPWIALCVIVFQVPNSRNHAFISITVVLPISFTLELADNPGHAKKDFQLKASQHWNRP